MLVVQYPPNTKTSIRISPVRMVLRLPNRVAMKPAGSEKSRNAPETYVSMAAAVLSAMPRNSLPHLVQKVSMAF